MLETALEAATAAGKLLRQNFGSVLTVNESTHHDVKLELDVQAQQAITRVIVADFPDHGILGEEGVTGPKHAAARWVVDPLDGTVNYYYSIPHYAVSIAAQVRKSSEKGGEKNDASNSEPEWETVAAVVYAPELDEMYAAARGQPATLNGRPIQVSDRARLEEAIVGIGFFKSAETIGRGLADFTRLIGRVRKMRLMGAAALDVVYVACGRFDAYLEYGIRLWDIAAGQFILEQAGGRADCRPTAAAHTFDYKAWNGKVLLT